MKPELLIRPSAIRLFSSSPGRFCTGRFSPGASRRIRLRHGLPGAALAARLTAQAIGMPRFVQSCCSIWMSIRFIPAGTFRDMV